jgi:hypothetical protein
MEEIEVFCRKEDNWTNNFSEILLVEDGNVIFYRDKRDNIGETNHTLVEHYKLKLLFKWVEL